MQTIFDAKERINNSVEKIKKFLSENKYEIYESDNAIEGNNEFLHILITKNTKSDKGIYFVRNAVRCYFDRWANSGMKFYTNSEDDVINYFSDKNKCIPDAVEELVFAVVEEAAWDNSDENIRKMIDFLYSLLHKPE